MTDFNSNNELEGSATDFRKRLVSALLNENFDKAEGILKEGGDIEERHRFTGKTILFEMESSSSPEAVDWLLERGADPFNSGDSQVNLWDIRVNKYLQMSIPEEAKIQFIDELLEKGADVNHLPRNGVSFIHTTAFLSMPEVTLHLIGRGADVNAQDCEGNTALIKASQRGDSEVAAILLDAGTDPAIKNKDGQTASDVAQEKFEITNRQSYENVKNLIESFTEKRELEKRLGLSDEVKTAKKVKV